MKKFYVTLVALAIATTSFAQVDNLPFSKQEAKNQNERNVKVIPFHKSQSKSSGSMWYSYFPDFYYYATGDSLDPESSANVMYAAIHCDTNAQIHYSNGDATVNFNGFGQIFNFGHAFWQNAAMNAFGNLGGISLPVMPSGTTYSVDSISIPFVYFRGDLQSPNVVDTIIISVLGDLTDANLSYYTHTQAGFVYSRIKYDTTNFVLKQIAGKKYHVEKIPLTVADETDEYVMSCNIAVPGFANLTNKNLVVFYTFKPGVPTNYNQFMGEEIADFRGQLFYDPRESFARGGADALVERNNSMNANSWTFNGENWPEYLPPTSIWLTPGVLRPAIYVKITCDDCSRASIKEMPHKNITIQPNPATSNFTVDLGSAGKADVEMFNLVGQKVYSTTTNDASIQVNVSDYKSGVYMLKINKNGQIYTSKVVVK